MRKHNILLLIITVCSLFLISTGCQKDDDVTGNPEAWGFEIGKNSYALEIGEFTRNVHVHVPSNYDENNSHPLVLMFHGSGGNGNNVYSNSGWKELAEREGFIVAFPTALEYYVVSVGRNQTKWSAVGLDMELEPGTEIVDDVPFVQALLDQIQLTFNIDDTRIYASGFSNGGGFSKSRLMVEMPDVFAAVGTSGGIGLPLAF